MTLEDRIRQQAYFHWLDSGGIGDSTYFWLIAEREVLAEVEVEATAGIVEAGPESPAHRLSRRVNALVLLESGAEIEEPELGIAAE